MATQPSLWRFTVEDYHRMAHAGIFMEDDRVELIDGEVIEMSPIGGYHVACVARLNRLLVERLGDDAFVNIQSPVHLNRRSEPEPDVAVVVARRYGRDLPAADDVLLLMEVSDTTLNYDRHRKLPLYARSGIQEVWIVDLAGQAIERHTRPGLDGYQETVRSGRGESIESQAVPGLVLDVAAVLGPEE